MGAVRELLTPVQLDFGHFLPRQNRAHCWSVAGGAEFVNSRWHHEFINLVPMRGWAFAWRGLAGGLAHSKMAKVELKKNKQLQVQSKSF